MSYNVACQDGLQNLATFFTRLLEILDLPCSNARISPLQYLISRHFKRKDDEIIDSAVIFLN